MIEMAYLNNLSNSLISSDKTSIQTVDNSFQMDTDLNSDKDINNDRYEVSVIETAADSFQSAEYIKTKLREWAVNERIPHNNLRKLLNLLQLIPSLSTTLPCELRTLLQTIK